MKADILAGVERQKNRMWFFLLLFAAMAATYVAHEAIKMPAGPPRSEPSVQCLTAGGTWQPESHDVHGWSIDAYCDRARK